MANQQQQQRKRKAADTAANEETSGAAHAVPSNPGELSKPSGKVTVTEMPSGTKREDF